MNAGFWLTSYSLLLAALMLLAYAMESLRSVLKYRRILRRPTTVSENLADFSLPLAALLVSSFVCQFAWSDHLGHLVLPLEWAAGTSGIFISSVVVMALRRDLAVWFPWSSRGRQARR